MVAVSGATRPSAAMVSGPGRPKPPGPSAGIASASWNVWTASVVAGAEDAVDVEVNTVLVQRHLQVANPVPDQAATRRQRSGGGEFGGPVLGLADVPLAHGHVRVHSAQGLQR